MAKALMIIAPERFRDEELFVTKEELEKAGHKTVIASICKGICPGSRGGFATATLTLAEVQTEDYDAVVFVGGAAVPNYIFLTKRLCVLQKKCTTGKKLLRLFVSLL